MEEGTPAEKLDGVVPPEIRKQRADEIMEMQQDISLKINQSKIGKTLEVLCERQLRDGRYEGRSDGDSPEIDGSVIFEADNLCPGDYAQVLILEAGAYDLEGKVPFYFEEE